MYSQAPTTSSGFIAGGKSGACGIGDAEKAGPRSARPGQPPANATDRMIMAKSLLALSA